MNFDVLATLCAFNCIGEEKIVLADLYREKLTLYAISRPESSKTLMFDQNDPKTRYQHDKKNGHNERGNDPNDPKTAKMT